MAFAFVASSVRIYPLIPETALRVTFEQVLEFSITAAVADTAFDLGAEALSDGSAQCLQIVALLGKVGNMHNYHITQSARIVTAAAGGHSFSGTAIAPVFTFDGAGNNCPTAMNFCIKWRLTNDNTPVVYNV